MVYTLAAAELDNGVAAIVQVLMAPWFNKVVQ